MVRRRSERFARLLGGSICVLLLALAMAVGGCVTKSKAKAQAHAAYLAGQQEALARMQQALAPSVTVNGAVRNRMVPWTADLTLAKALVAADYYGKAEPSQIIVVHGGVARRFDPKQLLGGVDVPLEAGDVVQIIAQPASLEP